ncbi:MAG: hypothetical protein AAF569_02505 [Pseudomonadota bacterium]
MTHEDTTLTRSAAAYQAVTFVGLALKDSWDQGPKSIYLSGYARNQLIDMAKVLEVTDEQGVIHIENLPEDTKRAFLENAFTISERRFKQNPLVVHQNGKPVKVSISDEEIEKGRQARAAYAYHAPRPAA